MTTAPKRKRKRPPPDPLRNPGTTSFMDVSQQAYVQLRPIGRYRRVRIGVTALHVDHSMSAVLTAQQARELAQLLLEHVGDWGLPPKVKLSTVGSGRPRKSRRK